MFAIVLYIALSLVIIYTAICAFYYFFQERLIFVSLNKLTPDGKLALASDFNEYTLEGVHEGKLHVLHIKSVHRRGCILYFHGNTGSMQRWGAIAEELTSFGFDIILPDYRGYGKSSGLRTEETLYSDALTCYHKARELFESSEICIYGRSLGTGVAAWLSANAQSSGLILETPYFNFLEAAAHHSKIIPVKMFLRFSFRSDLHLPHSKAPILIAHGTKDSIVPYSSGLKLYKSVKEKRDITMLTIPGGKHGNLNGFPIFRDTLNRFFDLHFPRG